MADISRLVRRVKRWTLLRRSPLAAAGVVALALLVWLVLRPSSGKAWSDQAITARFLRVSVEKDQKDAELILRYSLENHTGHKYRLPAPVHGELMQKMPDGTLHEVDTVLWDEKTAIPSRGTAVEQFEVSMDALRGDLQLEHLHRLDKLKVLGNQQLSAMRGLVFVDFAHHYNIELPRGWY